MRYNKIRTMDISNGEGVRVSLFVQGCDFHCKGCFNSEAWDFQGGKEFTTETLNTLLDLCDKEYIKGLSILGGEPLHPNNIETVANICKCFKQKYPNKTIWLWSGFRYEDILNRESNYDILNLIDILVDGQFEIDKKDLNLKWRGSSNQRVIDCKKSLLENKIILKNL